MIQPGLLSIKYQVQVPQSSVVVLHRRDDGEREIQGAAPGRRLGAVALHVAPLWCCWLASSGSGKQAARMQWFQAAPAHWRGSELLLYVSLAHGQQHRH